MREAKARGFVIGSGSDRVASDQLRLWETHGIEVDFVGGKHHLGDVRARFGAERYVHIGDTDVDRYYAVTHGFEFHHVEDLSEQLGARPVMTAAEVLEWLGMHHL